MKVLDYNFSCSALLTSWSDSIARHRSSHARVKSITPEQRTVYTVMGTWYVPQEQTSEGREVSIT